MADLKRKQLRQFLSGSFNITGSLNVTGSVEFDKNISGSLTSTGSFSRLQSDTISVTHSPFASGSEVQAIMDATSSFASASTTYLKESQTGSFSSGSDVQGILDTYVRQSESSSFASGSDLQVILAESASYVTLDETGSFASGSDLNQILVESSSYVSSNNTASLHQVLAESASYVVSTNTGSFLQNSDTASFSTLVVQGDITTSGSITAQSFNTEIVSSSVIFASGSTRFGDTIDDSHNMTGSLFVSGNITFDTNLTGSITSTGSFGRLETDTISVVNSPFASGSDLHQILAESSSYVLEQETGSFASGSDLQTILAESASYLVNSDTGSLGKLTLVSDITGSITSTASFGKIEVGDGGIDSSGDITLDGDGGDIILKDGGTEFGRFTQLLGGLTIKSGPDANNALIIGTSSNPNIILGGRLQTAQNITGSLSMTASFGRLDVADNTFISNNLSVGTDVVGQKLQVDGDVGFTGQLDVTGSVSGGLSSTGSFGYVEQLGVKLVDSNQTASFASGSDFHQILAESSSYMVSDQTGSMGTTTISSTLFVQDGITTSGSITAREFKTEFVSSSIIYASGSNQFGDTGDDVHEFSGSLKIGNLTFSTSSIGIQSDTDLISLSDDTFTLNGSIVINDGANIGIDSDTDLLDLNDQNLIINGKLDSTGRIDAQNGLQVSGSTLAVGNDLTLDYTSPVSHSLVFVNHTNKTIDLVPAASASGQLVQYDGSGWVITDEIDGGSF